MVLRYVLEVRLSELGDELNIGKREREEGLSICVKGVGKKQFCRIRSRIWVWIHWV